MGAYVIPYFVHDITHYLFKLEPWNFKTIQNTLVKIPIVLEVDWS